MYAGRFAAAGLAIAIASGAGAAGAAAGERLVADLRFTTHEPGRATGATLHLVWPAEDGSGRARPEKIGVFRLPAGSRVNEAAIPTCTASDTELKAEGGSACPGGSALGPGRVKFVAGLGQPVDPFTLDDYWYHGPHQIFGLFHAQGTSQPTLAVNRVEIRGASFIARPALPPGLGSSGKTAPKQSDQEIYGLTSEKGAFITTPPTCPAGGRWIAHAAVTYDDGSVQHATSATRCHRHG